MFSSIFQFLNILELIFRQQYYHFMAKKSNVLSCRYVETLGTAVLANTYKFHKPNWSLRHTKHQPQAEGHVYVLDCYAEMPTGIISSYLV